MKILLCCTAGMSTSVLVEKMKKAADKNDLDVEIFARSAASAIEETEGMGLDVILLAPQGSYYLTRLQEYAEIKNCPCALISPKLYGTFDGQKVLDFALELIENYDSN